MQRYGTALRLLNEGAGSLLIDANLSPSFTHDGAGLLYRRARWPAVATSIST